MFQSPWRGRHQLRAQRTRYTHELHPPPLLVAAPADPSGSVNASDRYLVELRHAPSFHLH